MNEKNFNCEEMEMETDNTNYIFEYRKKQLNILWYLFWRLLQPLKNYEH